MKDKYIGTLVAGCYCDILGSQYENLHRNDIDMRDLKLPEGKRHTDDTQMTLVLAEHLLRNNGEVNYINIHKEYAKKYFSTFPLKGYSKNTSDILKNILEDNFPKHRGNSCTNGSIMRIAPLALINHKNDKELQTNIIYATYYTHSNSPDSMHSCYVYCKLLRALLNEVHGKDFMKYFIYMLKLSSVHNTLFVKLNLVKYLLKQEHVVDMNLELSGNTDLFQIQTIDCLCCAVYAFFKFQNRPMEAIKYVISLGGDTDTMAKLVGDMCGAFYGIDWFPDNWIDGEGAARLRFIATELYNRR